MEGLHVGGGEYSAMGIAYAFCKENARNCIGTEMNRLTGQEPERPTVNSELPGSELLRKCFFKAPSTGLVREYPHSDSEKSRSMTMIISP